MDSSTALGLTEKDLEQDYDEIPTWALAVVAVVGLGALYATVYIALYIAVAMGWHA
ncbi:hypothetical protein ACIGKR_12350 [Rhodococcus qingshengii]|uniref:hypothetical protein n=1 Tax=Rhodococcus qingshengii TaxID=334542 RepID=UPI0037C8603F